MGIESKQASEASLPISGPDIEVKGVFVRLVEVTMLLDLRV